MSNSVKHIPIGGFTTSSSERIDKKIWHGRFRAANRAYILNVIRNEYRIPGYVPIKGCTSAYLFNPNEPLRRRDEIAPVVNDVSDTWSMNKDGKGWHGSRNGYYFWFGGIYEEPKEPLLPQLGRKVIRKGGQRTLIKDIMEIMRK